MPYDRTILNEGSTGAEPPPLFPDSTTLHVLDSIDNVGRWSLKTEVRNAPSFRNVRVWVSDGPDPDIGHRGPTVFIEVINYPDGTDWEPFGRYDGWNPPYEVNSFWTVDLGIDEL